MPAKKNKINSITEQDSKQKSDRQSNPGVYVSGGQIEQSDYDKLDFKTLMKDYTEMRNDDSIASSSIDILIYPILNSKFTIMPGYEEGEKPSDLAVEVAEYVQDIYNKLQSGLKYYIRHKLLALFYGFSIFEKIWKKGDTYNGKIVNRLVDLYPIQQDTIWWWKYDEQANFIGIKQEQRIPERGFKHIDIDAEYLHIYTPFEEFKNIQGRSMLRPSRLVWKIKRQIWMASGRASSRGAGIPEFQFTPTGNKENDTALKSTIETMARNVGNSDNAYVMSQPGVVDFKLHQLQNQEMNIQLIQQANTEMFYNTLSEFVTSGIGGNGSRAATGEHKSPYFDALDAIISTFEDNEDILIKEVIYNSPYASISDEELPYCVIERPKTTDVIGVGTLINNMLSSRSISKTPDIEVYLRNMLGLPEKTEEELEQVKEENIPEQSEPTQENKDGLQSQDKSTEETEIKKPETIDTKLSKLNKLSNQEDIFELANAQMVMQTAEVKAESVINDVYEKIIDDIAIKLERDPKAEIKLPYKKEMIDRLSKVFNESYKPGQIDVRKEYAKIAGTQLANLTPIIVEGNKDRLVAKVDTLYSAIENSIRDELLLINKQNIDNAGGMRKYIVDRFGQTQKQIKNDLASISSGGYIAGRNDQLGELEKIDPELKRTYLTSLEGRESVCEVCNPLNYMTMTREEADGIGVNFDSAPVNPLCLGGNKCRCTWQPAYTIGVR